MLHGFIDVAQVREFCRRPRLTELNKVCSLVVLQVFDARGAAYGLWFKLGDLV